jgi:hypothetical protein
MGFTVGDGGYVTSGSWKGYAFTASDGVSATTITPSDFSSTPAGSQLCVLGRVGGTSDYSGVAIFGINLNQAATAGALPSTWPTSSAVGVTYDLENLGGSALRIQLQAAGGDTDPSLRWCANLDSETNSYFGWANFTTTCWNNSGDLYDGKTPLESIMVVVPGALADVPFEFCVNSLAPLLRD